MKIKILSLIITLTVGILGLHAQQIERQYVVMEIATATWCYFCPGGAVGASDLINAGCDVAIIKNQNGDFSNAFSNARNDYYAIIGYPTAIFDGTERHGGGIQCPNPSGLYEIYRSLYDMRKAIASSYSIDIFGQQNGNSFEVEINAKQLAEYSGSNIVLQFYITETDIAYSWSTCMDELEWINRKMCPDENGTQVNLNIGQSQIIDLAFTIDSTWVPDNLEFVAFLQDNDTKEVLQAMKVKAPQLPPLPIQALFSVDNQYPLTGNTLYFNDLSIGEPSSWFWTFEGGQPATSTLQNPQVSYAAGGNFDVQLIVMDDDGNIDTMLKEDYIHCTEPHFIPVWDGNPLLPMTVSVKAAKLNQAHLEAGDEIAVFDGNNCVGMAHLSQTIDPNNNATFIYIACSQDDPDTPEIEGYSSGNTISYKMYDCSLNMETNSVTADFPYAPNFFSEIFIENKTIITELYGRSGYFDPCFSGNPLNPMTITVSKAELDELALIPGDEIGIFDGDYCVGAAILEQSIDPNNSGTFIYIPCSQDDPDTPEIDGFTADNTISYRVYDLSEEFESTSVSAVYPYAPEFDFTEFTINETNIVQLNALSSIIQTNDLIGGWNLVSWNVSLENMNIQDILQQLIDDNKLVKVIDQNGSILQHMPWGWINNIGNMSNSEGYQIKVSSNCQLSSEGLPVELPLTIPLISGFNLLGWPAQTAEDALITFTDIINSNQLQKVIDENGNILQHMPWGWVNNIGNMMPGEGYQVKVSSNCNLIVDEPSGGGKSVKQQKQITHIFHPEFSGNPLNPMAFAIKLNNNIPQGAEVGVFMGERCLDAAVVLGEYIYLSAGMDEEETAEIEGFTEGQSFHFFYQTAEMKQSESLQITYLEGDQSCTKRGTFVGELKESTGGNEYSLAELQFFQNYPNPFHERSQISFVLPQDGNVQLEILSLAGKSLSVLCKGDLKAGHHTKTISASGLAKGIYYCRLSFCSGISTQIKMRRILIY